MEEQQAEQAVKVCKLSEWIGALTINNYYFSSGKQVGPSRTTTEETVVNPTRSSTKRVAGDSEEENEMSDTAG